MRLQPATRTKLEHGKDRLAGEFTNVPKSQIEDAVDAAAGRLPRVARFDDYVPMLAQRYVRDTLLDRHAA
jgi:Protein of unknown function (DUF3562)